MAIFQIVALVHLVPYAGDHGVAPSSAILLLGVIGIGSTAGRFFLGELADAIGRERSDPGPAQPATS